MTGLEIFFMTSMLSLVILWIWFINQGFRASRLWGIGLIFLFPISPFMFAYRFERKSRQAIFYFLGCLLVFLSTLFYIHFATIDFYPTFLTKTEKLLPHFDFSSKPKLKKPNPPPLIYIPPPPEPVAKPVDSKIIIVDVVKTPSTITHRYQTIEVSRANSYIGKNVIIGTETITHRGRLMSVDDSEVIIRKTLMGGSMVMGVKKSKIIKFEVFL